MRRAPHARCRGRLHLRIEPGGGSFGVSAKQCAQELILGVEVPVERPRRHVGLSQDVGNRRIGISVPLHDDERGIEQDA